MVPTSPWAPLISLIIFIALILGMRIFLGWLFRVNQILGQLQMMNAVLLETLPEEKKQAVLNTFQASNLTNRSNTVGIKAKVASLLKSRK